MVVRDEGDIIEQSLNHWLNWCDGLYLLDTGSTDGTWDIVQKARRQDTRVVPFRRIETAFHDGLRAWVFDQYRGRFRPGDWVFRADADEFLEVSPRDFVQDLRPFETRIDLQWYYFRLTDRDVAAWESGEETTSDRSRPIQERRRYYTVPSYTEPRGFRYRQSMRWALACSGPYNMGIVAARRIPIRHYPHRDPLQMEMRARNRREMYRLGAGFGHWNLKDWRSDVAHVDGAQEETGPGEGLAAIDGLTSGLHVLHPGEGLPSVPSGPNTRTALRRLFYSLAVPGLDRLRTGFPAAYEPPSLPSASRR